MAIPNQQQGISLSGDGSSSARQASLSAFSGEKSAQASHTELSLHPDSQTDGEVSEADDDDDVVSVRSTWDYKRSNDPEADDDVASVAPSEALEEGESMSQSQTEHYVEAIREIIETLSIEDAVLTSRSKSILRFKTFVFTKRPVSVEVWL